MRKNRTSLFDLTLLALMVAGVPILVVLLLALAEDPPREVLAILAGLYLAGLIWTGMNLWAKFDELRALGWAAMAARRTILSAVPTVRLPAMVSDVPVRNGLFALSAVGSAGGCPRGFQVGDKWFVDTDGRLSPELCTAALQALEPAMTRFKQNGHISAKRVSCACPVRGHQLTFAVARAATAA
jgi:uncharacterized repeat protein (TIGR04076 family)